jgi:hypothetical protein
MDLVHFAPSSCPDSRSVTVNYELHIILNKGNDAIEFVSVS